MNPLLVLPLALKVSPLELLGSSHGQMSGYFASPKLRALFSFQDLYVGLSPYTAPGVFSLLAATELTDGVWYPKGGFGKVRDALLSLARSNGAEVRLGAEVAAIEVERDAAAAAGAGGGGEGAGGGGGGEGPARVTGVRLASGERLAADVVVSNVDLPWTYEALLGRAGAGAEFVREGERTRAMDFSASVVAFNWALSAPLPGLLHHNVFLSSDYRGSWDRPCAPADLAPPRQLNFYAHYPCATDPSAAPPGCASLMVLLPVGNLAEQGAASAAAGGQPADPAAMVAAARGAVLRRLAADGHGDVAALIVSETVIPPAEWEERYSITHGAVFGLAHGLTQLACFRPPTRTGLPFWPSSPPCGGLHFVGASTRPGNGVARGCV